MKKRTDLPPQILKQRKRRIQQFYTLISLLLAFISGVELWYWDVGVGWKNGFIGYRAMTLVGIFFCIVYWFFARMYKAHKIGLYRLTELTFSQTLAYAITDAILFAAAFLWFHNFHRLRLWIFVVALILQVAVITLSIFVCNRLFARYDKPRNVLIIYGDEDYKLLLAKMKAVKYRYHVQSCRPDTESFDQLKKYLDVCEDVYLYQVNNELQQRIVLYCELKHIDIHVSLDIEDLITMGYEISHHFDTPFIRNKRVPVIWYYPFLKRTFDIICSLTALILLSPILLVTAFLIHHHDKGPVFYKQVRLTEGGRPFKIIKFRSMIVNAESGGARLASTHDDRITPVGHFIRATRIDELPQLLNILKGDMSIVGPRPERPEIAEQYTEEIPLFPMRLRVKAGLTGYAQVYGKYNTTPLDKLKLDLLYITNRSVTFDLRIIFYTIKIIFIPESTEGIAEGMITASRHAAPAGSKDPSENPQKADSKNPH